jgi:3-deoxy-7-phosphoheptulonate synthase
MSTNTTTPIPTPREIVNSGDINQQPSESDFIFIKEQRAAIHQILTATHHGSDKLLVIVGPCSIHNYEDAITYATKLAALAQTLPNLFIVMRVYFEKPRTRGGWKGFIYDPDLDETCDIVKGLKKARALLLEITRLRLPIACEFLDTITPQYLADLVSWGAIGARTAESQIHRQLASALSMPVGFKNLTDGNYEKAIDGIFSAAASHTFLGIDLDGRAARITTQGNSTPHLILRGGSSQPNYDAYSLSKVTNSLKHHDIQTKIIIDCSHGNSQKQHRRQLLSAFYIARLRKTTTLPIAGIMLESNLCDGSQKMVYPLTPGKSITDACIGWDATEQLLRAIDTLIIAPNTAHNTIANCQADIDRINAALYSVISNSADVTPSSPIIPSPLLNVPYPPNLDVELLQFLESNIFARGQLPPPHAYLLVAERQAYSEHIGMLKFSEDRFTCLLKETDLSSYVTNVDRENQILSAYPHRVFRHIMRVSKQVQLRLLEEIRSRTRIGYLFGPGTFSHEAVSLFAAGTFTPYPNIDELCEARATGEVDFILVPTTNSIIGTIYTPPRSLKVVGEIRHKIELALFSNRQPAINSITLWTLYIEPHVAREAEEFIKTLSFFGQQTTSSTLDAICRTMDSVKPALTIASTHTKSTLYKLRDNIVPYNFTTFSLLE